MHSAKIGVLLLIAIASFYRKCEGRTVKVRTDTSGAFVTEGQIFQFKCWAVADQSPAPSSISITYTDGGSIKTLVNNSRITITSKTEGLTLTRTVLINPLHVGDAHDNGYMFKSEGHTAFLELFVLPAAAIPQIDLSKSAVTKIDSKATLSCNASTVVSGKMPNPTLEIKWTFSKLSKNNGTDVSSKAKSSTASIGSTRKIDSILTTTVSSDTAGYYHCHVMLNAHVKTAVFVYTKNTTIDLPLSVAKGVNAKQKIKVFQKKNARMVCKVTAFPPPIITWKKNKEPVTASSNNRYKFSDDGENKNAVFDISATEYSDRAIYTCTAASHSSVTMEFTLRVRDPLGPLWPFIGIVIEAIVLAIMIITYEKFKGGKGKKGRKGTKERLETSPLIDKSKDPGVEYTAGGKGRDDSVRMRGTEEVKA